MELMNKLYSVYKKSGNGRMLQPAL